MDPTVGVQGNQTRTLVDHGLGKVEVVFGHHRRDPFGDLCRASCRWLDRRDLRVVGRFSAESTEIYDWDSRDRSLDHNNVVEYGKKHSLVLFDARALVVERTDNRREAWSL